MCSSSASSTSGLSETGSLDRAKAALERRKKASDEGGGGGGGGVQDRVMTTRVDPNTLIAELMSSTNLVQTDESAELSGLQLFIAKDGTTALGSHEVKSQMPAGVFKQVVMDLDNSSVGETRPVLYSEAVVEKQGTCSTLKQCWRNKAHALL
uniref:Uncharacterized protein n=1 Tax=Timema bartmani TaxID=61472 RepID=A0A7R9F7M3_9NEOP|nr:unnamed protein product [Timema bartmani]